MTVAALRHVSVSTRCAMMFGIALAGASGSPAPMSRMRAFSGGRSCGRSSGLFTLSAIVAVRARQLAPARSALRTIGRAGFRRATSL